VGGICLGATVALEYASRFPDRIARLVLHTPIYSPQTLRTAFKRQVAAFTAGPVFWIVDRLRRNRVVSDLYKRFLVEGPGVDPHADCRTGRGHFRVSQGVSEQQFNTAGLQPWGGLKPPSAGSRPDVRILGVPMDRGSVYRPGAAKAPAELRKLSAIFAPVSEH